MHETHNQTGNIGTGVTVGAWIVQMATDALPLLHVMSAFLACITGVLTVIWYIKQLRKS